MKNRLLKYIILLFCAVITASSSHAQSFSFNCARDTTISGCGTTSCFTLQHIIPDIHANTGAYTVNPIPRYSSSCFPIYTPPNGPGTSAGFTDDDVYSAPLDIGFPFYYYGATYNRVLMSPNGLLCFDLGLANIFAHFGILDDQGNLNADIGPPVNLPSTMYSRAVIMGPYHDLNPIYTTSPTQKIQYTVTGIAPHRRWVASYYKVPMYTRPGSGCELLIENTHQIVLYESTGIVEVLIAGMQICGDWNEGRAMVGMQNYNRDQGIMAPGRRASDNPWGSPGMNETWRFVPSSGASLFRRAELFDLAGTLVSTGTITNLNNGQLRVDFPNICGPAGTTTYIARSVYTKIDNPGVEIFGSDTIRVTRNNTGGLNATATSNAATCGQANGTATINVPSGNGVPPYQYSLNGGPLQASNTFINLAAGTYTGLVQDAGGCSSTVNITVGAGSSLTATIAQTNVLCNGGATGTISISNISGGTVPYQYSLDGAMWQTSNTFNGLIAGTYTVYYRDNGGCQASQNNILITQPAALTLTSSLLHPGCGNSSGSITLSGVGGLPPYQYSLNGTTWQSGNIFSGLSAGNYQPMIRDNNSCTQSLPVTLTSTGSLGATIDQTNPLCNGSGTGSITVSNVTGGTAPYQYSLDGTTWQTSNIFNGLIAGTYTVYYRDNSGCQASQNNISITQPTVVSLTHTVSHPTCTQSNGSITLTGEGGVAPYEYSLNGTTWQTGNTFSGLAAGSYQPSIRDDNGCTQTLPAVILSASNSLQAAATVINATCLSNNRGSITINVTGGAQPYTYSLNNENWQQSNSFNVTPGSYTAYVLDNAGCVATINGITVGMNNILTLSMPANVSICEGSSTQLAVSSIASQFSWSPVIGLSNPGIANPVANPVTSTQYTVTATLGTCQLTGTINLIVNPAPIANAGADIVMCQGQSIQLQGSGGTRYTWSPTTFMNGTGASPTITPDRDITYILSVMDANNCSSLKNDSVKVVVKPPFTITLSPSDTVVHAGDRFRLSASSIATAYSWSPTVGLDNPFISNPELTVTTDNLYKVTGTTPEGCKAEGFVKIRVYKGPDMYIPTGFTPNGDGRNDTFAPFTVGIKQIKYFRVFNRSGQLIFSTNRIGDAWDGRFKGATQPSDVYVWMAEGITANNEVITKKGTIMLIR
ncbi:hypothetical protein CAP36_05845 [Chitinophagaceae bacterium IBVUCB2]|nr:hypothetical protein CAP36_05845 [Chitinophagaceae bacterium IBVUCB2]